MHKIIILITFCLASVITIAQESKFMNIPFGISKAELRNQLEAQNFEVNKEGYLEGYFLNTNSYIMFNSTVTTKKIYSIAVKFDIMATYNDLVRLKAMYDDKYGFSTTSTVNNSDGSINYYEAVHIINDLTITILYSPSDRTLFVIYQDSVLNRVDDEERRILTNKQI